MKMPMLASASAALVALLPVNGPAVAQAATTQAEDTAPISPERLAAARQTVARVFPRGTYARLMERSMGAAMDNMMESVGVLPLRDLAAVTGASSEQLDRLGEGTLKEMLAIIDPAYEERMRVTMKVMGEQMSGLMAQFEPAFQDGLARAYARQFDTKQLADLNAFFATPTGSAYASESMMLFADPEVMGKMREIMPEMMKQMPKMIKAVTQATANLPKQRKPEDLSPAEREKLEALMGKPDAVTQD
ncbi:MAG: DUF2059 domain-containing protein [Novosphingobium sp.]|nr:DUF2059 domain-containing protein [Novosphingobium sp.]